MTSNRDSAMSYFERGEDEEDVGLVHGEDEEQGDVNDYDGRTPLDRTIDRIGMGTSLRSSRLRTQHDLTDVLLRLSNVRELPVDSAILVRVW